MSKPREPASYTPAPLPVAALDDSQRLACLRLIRSDNVGPVTFRELINHYGGADLALEALPELSRRGRARRPARIFPKAAAEAELAAAAKVGAAPVFTIEPGYPAALAAVDVPPPLLYVKGRTNLLNGPVLAIVGSREASAAGHKLARQFAGELGRAGIVIASGLARGIDAAAHEASLATGTVAVLAGGIDIIYPPEHEALHATIAERGCLVTEQPPGFRPRAQDFPRRNRIISGLSLATLVIEAAHRSGSLVTARLASEQGREVFAVPGHPLDPRAEGTNRLLKSGATLVTCAADILEVLGPIIGRQQPSLAEQPEHPFEPRPSSTPPPLVTSDEQACVVRGLGPQPIDVDELARATGLPPRTVRIILMELDLAGRIERHGAQLVSLLPTDDN